MKFVIIIVQAIAVAGGAFLGFSFKDKPAAPSHAEAGADADSHAEKDKASKEHGEKSHADAKKDKKGKKKDGKGGKDGGHGEKSGHGDSAAAGDAGYMKFSRQFVVPVIKRDAVEALVIFDINLELDPSAAQDAYNKEPKLRDALLRSLLQLSNEGAFGDKLTDEENLEEVRARLLASAKSVLEDDVSGVLILNVARQDV